MPEKRSKNFEKVKDTMIMGFGKSKECETQFLDGLPQKSLSSLLEKHTWKNS